MILILRIYWKISKIRCQQFNWWFPYNSALPKWSWKAVWSTRKKLFWKIDIYSSNARVFSAIFSLEVSIKISNISLSHTYTQDAQKCCALSFQVCYQHKNHGHERKVLLNFLFLFIAKKASETLKRIITRAREEELEWRMNLFWCLLLFFFSWWIFFKLFNDSGSQKQFLLNLSANVDIEGLVDREWERMRKSQKQKWRLFFAQLLMSGL